MIAVIAIFIANVVNAQAGAIKQQAIQHSIKTIYPTKDWIISDFIVTDPKFGAKAQPGFDNRPAFHAAMSPPITTAVVWCTSRQAIMSSAASKPPPGR